MPKSQHSKDRLFITATGNLPPGHYNKCILSKNSFCVLLCLLNAEWSHEYGGKKRERVHTKRALPFDSCALSLQPYENPVCTKDGVIFDMLHIMPFLQKHKCNPVNSEPMRFKDLITLNMAKNQEGKWHCPVTFKVFTDNSKVVCVRTSKHVYAWEAVNDLNIKAKNWKDLMTDEPFTREDLIMLQDPNDEALNARRDISNFSYLKEMRDDAAADRAATPAAGNIRATPQTAALFKDIEAGREAAKKEAKEAAAKAEALVEIELDSIPDLAAIRKLRPTYEDINPGSKQTAVGASGSFTSSGVEVATKTEMRLATVDEIREVKSICRF